MKPDVRRAPQGGGPSGDPTTPLPWLLRRVNRRFAEAVGLALVEHGFAGVRPQGMWAMQALHEHAGTASELVAALQITKQAVSVLVDELVGAGYVERAADPADRRRTLLRLSQQGGAAAAVIERTCARVEKELATGVGDLAMRRLRTTLGDLAWLEDSER